MRSSLPLEPLTSDEEEEPPCESITETPVHDQIEEKMNYKQEAEVYQNTIFFRI